MLSSLALVLALGLTPQHWTALSQTAMSITGDVTFQPTQMTFAGGKSVALSYLKKIGQYALYRVSAKSNPHLLRGNTICGPALPGYVAVARDGGDVAVSFFSAGIPPSNVNAPSLCATYRYIAH
ncbi:MAG TPA: hypothetical protein VIG46_01195, partial [Candidatus Baltobacteraceae bacterium]|jgi:hypothetical protein